MDPEDYTAHDGAPWPTCWSCLKPFRDGRVGVCLDDSGAPSVCRHCWLKLPEAARVAFKMLGPTAAWVRYAMQQMAEEGTDPANWWRKFTERGKN